MGMKTTQAEKIDMIDNEGMFNNILKMRKLILKVMAVILIITASGNAAKTQILNENAFKLSRTLTLIDAFYVDTVNLNSFTEKVITNMLRSLDPHSTYISAKDVKEMNEPLLGNFEGIGIQFNILHDTIIVVEPVKNGPSERVGIKPGDRIVKINGENVANINISTSGVRSRLMGPKGTKVEVTISRKGEKDLYNYTIIRDKIPINSLDAAYMLNNETAYFKFNKFAATTEKEFLESLSSMPLKSIKNVIIDMRGNPGGYMLAAVALANHFLEGEKLVVYMEGRRSPREEFKSNGKGLLTRTNLVVLTDEASASASEIFAGAVQEWDRGVIVGRRTFGKGLVQSAFTLNDGSQVRLTVARYYTPTGRSIQSPYGEGYQKYIENYLNRFRHGETISADSIKLPDSLRYNTLLNRRSIYGSGGIMPDVFVSQDTSYYTLFYRNLLGKDIPASFTLEFADKNREKLLRDYKDFDDFKRRFEFTKEDMAQFIKLADNAGVKYVEDQYKISEQHIRKVLKALVANNLWRTTEYFRIYNEDDQVIEKALKIISDQKEYRKILGY